MTDGYTYIQPELKGILPEPIPCGAEVGKGWVPLVIDLHRELKEIDPEYSIDQVKEKFGLLRVYANHRHQDLCLFGPMNKTVRPWECPFGQAILKAEQKSSTICEECGRPGSIRSGGWTKTLCDEHATGRAVRESV